MLKKLVSVIMPVYNGEDYIAEALNSIFAQSYRNFQVIVVDDGSSDYSACISQSYREVTYIYQENQGTASAMNAGLIIAVGEFIAFLDADDIWETQKLSLQVGFLEENKHVDMVVAGTQNFLDPMATLPSRITQDLTTNVQTLLILGAVLTRISIFRKVGIFNDRYLYSNDIDWFIRAREKGVCMKIMPETLLRRRLHSRNLSYHHNARTLDHLRVIKSLITRKREQNT